MKTKNIFRMLLVAAALLMGANNVKAELWPTNTESGLSQDLTISKDVLKPLVKNGTKIHVYVTNTDPYWALLFSLGGYPNFQSPSLGQWGDGAITSDQNLVQTDDDNNKYLELVCNAQTVSQVNNNDLRIYKNQGNITVTKVVLINEAARIHTITFLVDGEEWASQEVEYLDNITLPENPTKTGYVFTGWENLPSSMPDEDVTVEATFREGVEQTAWEDGPFSLSDDMQNSGLSIENSSFNNLSGSVYVRVYGSTTHSTDWRIKIGYFDGNNVLTPTFGDYDQGQISFYSSESLKGSLLYGYVEFLLNSTELGLLAQNGARIGGNAFTATKVTVISSSVTTDNRATLTLTFTDSEKEITVGDTYTNTLSATVGDDTVNDLDSDLISYTSDDSSIAEVSSDGSVLGKAVGETTITVSYEGDETYKPAEASYTIKVVDAAAPKYTVSYTAEIYNEDQTKVGTVEMRNNVVEYEEDATVTFYVTPEEGYEIDAVTVTGDSYEETLTAVSTDSEGITIYRFTMPNKDVTINVTFKVAIVKYAVETIASPSEGGSITLVGDETRFAEGDPVSFTVTPNAGYQIVTLSVTSNDNNVECSFANGAYSFTMPAAPVTITATFEIRTISVTIGTHGAATFSDAEAVAIPEGLTAFYAKEVDDNMVKLEEIITGFIPANTGVVLRGEPGTYDVQLATSTVSAITGNLLVGVTTVDEYECKSANQYVLTYHEGTGLVFAQTSSAVPAQVQYGQAYLQWTATAGSRLRLSFGESTGISNIEAETTNDGVIYNLRGQRVENPTKGLYIINGKKVIIK